MAKNIFDMENGVENLITSFKKLVEGYDNVKKNFTGEELVTVKNNINEVTYAITDLKNANEKVKDNILFYGEDNNITKNSKIILNTYKDTYNQLLDIYNEFMKVNNLIDKTVDDTATVVKTKKKVNNKKLKETKTLPIDINDISEDPSIAKKANESLPSGYKSITKRTTTDVQLDNDALKQNTEEIEKQTKAMDDLATSTTKVNQAVEKQTKTQTTHTSTSTKEVRTTDEVTSAKNKLLNSLTNYERTQKRLSNEEIEFQGKTMSLKEAIKLVKDEVEKAPSFKALETAKDSFQDVKDGVKDYNKEQKTLSTQITKSSKEFDNYGQKTKDVAKDVLLMNYDTQILNQVLGLNAGETITAGEALKKLKTELNKQTTTSGVEKVTIAYGEFKNKIEEVQKAHEEALVNAKAYAGDMATFATNIQSVFVNGVFKAMKTSITNIIDAVKDLDEELVEIKKVTDLSDAELTDFVQQIKEIGTETATTTSDLLEASAVFARSGYTKDQIAMLTEEAAVLHNVSDGIDNMASAAEVLISAMKAYHVAAEDVRTVTDQLNNISNNAAISFDDLAEGIERAGATFSAAGVSIGQLSGLLTGTNEVKCIASVYSNIHIIIH